MNSDPWVTPDLRTGHGVAVEGPEMEKRKTGHFVENDILLCEKQEVVMLPTVVV